MERRIAIIGSASIGKESLEVARALLECEKTVVVIKADTKEIESPAFEKEPLIIKNIDRYEHYAHEAPIKSYKRPYKYHP